MLLHDQTTMLRRLTAADLIAFQAYRNDPAVAEFQSWDQMDDAQALGFLNYMSDVDPLLRASHWAQVGVALFSSNLLIGDMGLFLSDDQTEAEIGITLARSAQQQGHAGRAMRMGISHMFRSTPIQKIRAWSDVRNEPSLRLLSRLNFKKTGAAMTDGIEEAAFVMTRSAWLNQ